MAAILFEIPVRHASVFDQTLAGRGDAHLRDEQTSLRPAGSPGIGIQQLEPTPIPPTPPLHHRSPAGAQDRVGTGRAFRELSLWERSREVCTYQLMCW